MNPYSVEPRHFQFSGSSGYARQGDTVSLFADRIEHLDSGDIDGGDLVLQLWACHMPYYGGELTGWKLAEAPLGVLRPGHFMAPVRYDVAASFPEAGDFAMTLVIAEWDGAGFNRIHDFHTYPDREVFLHPRLEGQVGYRLVDDAHLVVDVERIYNPRDPDNLSGTLSLELWALAEPYGGGDFQGYALGSMTSGTLAGDASWQNTAFETAITPPPAGSYTLVLMLREWTGNGYVTRDHCNFDQRVTFPLARSADQAGDSRKEDAPEQILAPAEPSGPGSGTPPVEAVDQTASAAARPIPKDTGQTSAPGAGDGLHRQSRHERFKQSLQRAWEWLKRNW